MLRICVDLKLFGLKHWQTKPNGKRASDLLRHPADRSDQRLQMKVGVGLRRDVDTDRFERVAHHRSDGGDTRSRPAGCEFLFQSLFGRDIQQPPDLRGTCERNNIDFARRHFLDGIGDRR